MSDCKWYVRTDILNDGYHIIKFHHRVVESGHDSADTLLADMVIIETSTMSVFAHFLKNRPHSQDPLQLVMECYSQKFGSELLELPSQPWRSL